MPAPRWLAHLFAPTHQRPPRQRGRARPVLEDLECRVVPSTFTEVEPNDTPAQANVVTPGIGDVVTTAPEDWLTIIGSVTAGSDYFRFTLDSPAGVFFDVDSRDTGLSTALDSVLRLYASNGTTELADNDDGYDFEGFNTPVNSSGSATSRDSSLYADLDAGTYFIRVTGFGGSTGDYHLRVLADPNYGAVPVLNSRPGAADTFYLDFNGHSANDAWGNYTATAFDFNGTAGEFSPAERLAVRNIWSVVSEDYSPFNINITTVQPGSFNDGVGFRHVITNSAASTISSELSGGVLGVAFLNSYAGGGSSNNVAFTFAANFDTFEGTLSGQIMAAAVERGNTTSHEFGHALGLEHYATSPGTAGPGVVIPNAIMATPDQGLNRETWASGTSEAGTNQVDLNVIGNATNTFGTVLDDHGGTPATATVLTPTVNSYTSAGILHTATEEDFFRFTASGATTIRIDVNDYVSNLDVAVSLLDASGILVASSDPSGSFDATVTQTLTAGTYSISVVSNGGVGEVGRYTVQITTTLNSPPVASDLALTIEEDTDLSGTAPATDPDGNPLTYTIVSGPLNGTLISFNTNTGAFVYRPDPDYSNTPATPDTFTFRASDGTFTSNLGTVSIVVTPVDDTLVVTTSGGSTAYIENAPPVVLDAALAVFDSDNSLLDGATVRITAGYVNGEDELAFAGAGGITGSFSAPTGTLTLSGTGTVAEYEAALRTVTYFNTSANPSNTPRTLTFNVIDDTTPSAGATKTLIVAAANEAPVNTVPSGPMVEFEDTPRRIGGISVADVDAGTGTIVVTLSVVNGALTVSTTAAGGLTAGQVLNNGTASLTLTGTLGAINVTLAAQGGPRYAPAPHYHGPDTLTITTDDQGNTGLPVQSDTDQVAIDVREVNDLPDGADDSLSGIAEDSGARSIPFAVLLANDNSGPENESDQALTVASVGNAVGGTVALVGGAVVFTPAENFNGTASFTYTIRDDGTTNGAPDPRTSSARTVTFTVTPVDEPSAVAGQTDQAIAFGLGVGSPALAALFGADGSLRFVVDAFPGFLGGVSTAAGDVNGDGTSDLIVGTASGFSAVRVFDGTTGNLMTTFFAFPGLAGGVSVAANDVNGDGFADLFVAPLGSIYFGVFSGRDQSVLGLGLPGGVFVG